MAVNDLGTVKPGSTILLPFHTFDSNDPSGSVTITGLALADVGIYKGTSMTERASTTGVVLLDTDGIDIDTTTGIHGLSIDLSSNATAGFYAAGSRYYVTIASITVDGATTVNFVLGTFYIGYPGALLDTTIAAYTSTDNFTLNTGSADNDAYNGCLLVAHDVASAVQTQIGVIEDYTGASKTVNLKADPGIFTMTANDNISIFPPALIPTTRGTTLDVTATGAAGIDWGNVENPTTAVDLSGTDIQLADTTTTVTNDVGVNEWNGVALGTTNPLPNAAAGAAGGLPTDSAGKTSFNDLSAAQVNTEVDNAIVTYRLDHLLFTSVADTDVADNSVIAKFADSTAVTADYTNYDWTTDSLRAIRDHVGNGANLTEAGGTGDHLTAINLPNQTMDITGNITGNLSGSVGSVTGAVGSVTGAVGSVTGNVGGVAGTITTLDALDTAQDTQHSTTQTNIATAQTDLDTLTDAYGEPTGVPAASATLNTKIGYLYMALRNKITVSSTDKTFFDDDGTTQEWSKPLTDDGSTYTEGEAETP